MSLSELIKVYSPKSKTQILLYMRSNYEPRKYFTIEELAQNLERNKGLISRDLNKLERDGLIEKK